MWTHSVVIRREDAEGNVREINVMTLLTKERQKIWESFVDCYMGSFGYERVSEATE